MSPGHESRFLPDFDKIPAKKRAIPVPPDAPYGLLLRMGLSKYQVDFILRTASGNSGKCASGHLAKTDFYVPDRASRYGRGGFLQTHRLPSYQLGLGSPTPFTPAGEPEPPLPYEHYEDAVPALWADYQ